MEPSGVLIVNKHMGATSHDIVNKIRRLYGTKKVGHTGTLDPMATGVLVVLVGRAAKAAEFLSADRKSYLATLRLGITTDTEDTTGQVLTSTEQLPDEEAVKEAVGRFIGNIKQIPPMYSALKVGGKKLCDLARQGIVIEREARDITIHKIECKKINDCDYSLLVDCSAGTYIRTLCADIGASLGCGGAMASLERCAAGEFHISASHTTEELEAMTEEERISLLLPIESLFSELPRVTLDPFYEKLSRNGCEIYQKKIRTSYQTGTKVQMYGKVSGFYALGQVFDYEDGSAIKSIKMFDV
jgi:tRNA pseudouridine55 synthase